MDLAKCLRGLLTHKRYDRGITVISDVIRRHICGEIICISYKNNNSTPLLMILSQHSARIMPLYPIILYPTALFSGKEGFSLFRLSRVDSCQSKGYSPFETILSVFSLELMESNKSMTDISIVTLGLEFMYLALCVLYLCILYCVIKAIIPCRYFRYLVSRSPLCI